MEEIILEDCIGFDWDKGNQAKNTEKHAVLPVECEQLFLMSLYYFMKIKNTLLMSAAYMRWARQMLAGNYLSPLLLEIN